MQNTKLIQLLKTFSAQEFKQFGDFIISPIYNKNKKVFLLYESLKKYYPEFDSNDMANEKIFIKIFPKEEYDYFKIKNVISDLLMLGKEYLAFIHFRNNSKVKDIYLLKQLRERNLDTMFEQVFKTAKKELEENSVKDENYFYSNFEITGELISYYTPKEPNKHFHLKQEEFDYFHKYSVICLLKFYNLMLHEQRQNNFDFDFKMIDEVFEYLKKNKSEENPTLLIYYNIILLEKEKDEKYFFELKNLKDKYLDLLNKGDQYMFFLHMAGFCAYAYNVLESTGFMYEHFLLSKENFDRGSIELGKILYMDFLNHVKIAVRVNEFDWAEKYIDKFKSKLNEEKESTLNFCYGYIYYKKGNLSKALDLLSQTNFPNFIIKVQVKILLLQIYYESEMYEQALAMIDTFKHYVKSEKGLLEDFKNSFTEYLRLTNELIKIKTRLKEKQIGFDKKKISEGIEKIKFNQFGIKLWLREKVSELN